MVRLDRRRVGGRLSLAHIRGRHGARGRQFHADQGDIVVVTKFDYWFSGPERGDVTLCRLPEHSESETYLKRVAAVPGDTYAIRGGVAYLNGEATDEPYATGTEDCEDFEITLAENEYLVLGDNRPESYDSRAADVGVLSKSDFIGRARLKVWPLEQFFRPIY